MHRAVTLVAQSIKIGLGCGGSVRFLLTLLLIVGFVPSGYSQDSGLPTGFPSKPSEPPSVLPAGCPAATIVHASTLQGTEAYLLMGRQIAAFKLGHEASQELEEALRGPSDPNSTMLQSVIHMNTGLGDAQRTFLCASFLIGGETANDDTHRDMRGLLVSVFNRMALGAWQLQGQMQKMAEDAEASKKVGDVKTAQAISAILQDRKEAGTDLVTVATMSALLTVYAGDVDAKTTPFVTVSCSERTALLTDLSSLTKATPIDEFTRSAGILEEFFQGHKCRAQN